MLDHYVIDEMPVGFHSIMCKSCKVVYGFTTHDLSYICLGFYGTPPCPVCKTINQVDELSFKGK